MTTYLIVGNGVAANTAAETIRASDPSGRILMFSKERHYFYYVPALPEYLSREKRLETITIHNGQWYRQHGIDIRLNTEITSIDPRNKTAAAQDGTAYPYDKLLLATGGTSFVPPIKGLPADGVFTLRTIDDADAIKERAKKSRKLVLIGGGLLGLEAGNGLRKLGPEVSVVEFFPRLLPRQMDEPGAAMLQKQMEEMGFTFHLGAKTQEIVSGPNGLAVHLEGGETIAADMVLVSAGVRPEVTLARSLGLEIDKGVKVDDAMKTGLDDVYAAGDLIEHRGRFYGLWAASRDQGRVAGLAMAGKDAAYEGTVPSNTLKVVGIDLVAAGEIDAEGKMQAVTVRNDDKHLYRKFVLQGDVLVGAILFGDIRGSEMIQNAIKAKRDIALFKDDLADPNFDFNRLK